MARLPAKSLPIPAEETMVETPAKEKVEALQSENSEMAESGGKEVQEVSSNTIVTYIPGQFTVSPYFNEHPLYPEIGARVIHTSSHSRVV